MDENKLYEKLARHLDQGVMGSPMSPALRDPSNILPFDAMRPKIEEQSFCAVAHCPCRQMKRGVGERSSRPRRSQSSWQRDIKGSNNGPV